MKKFYSICALFAMFGAMSANAEGSVNIPTSTENPFDLNTATIEIHSTFAAKVKDNGSYLNLDYMGEGDVAVFALNNTKEASYKITFESATPQDASHGDFEIFDEKGDTIYSQNTFFEKTGATGGDWDDYVLNSTLAETPVLPVGKYTFKITMHEGITWSVYTANIRNIAFTAVESGSTGESETVTTGTVIYSWESPEGTAIEVGGTAESRSDTDGKNRVNYSNTDPNDDHVYYTLSLAGSAATYPESAYIFIALDNALATGDEITVTAYRNKNALEALATIQFYFDNDASLTDENTWPNIHPDGEGDKAPGTNTFTVPAEANGSKSISLTRAVTGTNLFITKLVVTRADSAGESGIADVTVAEPVQDNIRYNLQGIPVDESYKGIYIMNGKKYINR